MKESLKLFAKEVIKPVVDILLYPLKAFFRWTLYIEDKYLAPIYIKLFPDTDPLKYLFPLLGLVLLIGIIYIIVEDCKGDR